MSTAWLASVAGACARMTLTRPDQWYPPQLPEPLQGVWMQGPNGTSAFCIPEDACATRISLLDASGRLVHQDLHIADPAMS